MAATRLIALHANKGRTIAQSLGDRTDYAKNPEKTEKGELVTAYGCDPMTVDEEFLLQKRLYLQITGKSQKSDVIAYQIRQSFKPGEVTPEEANRLGHELAMRFTKGKYSFIVATHTDRAHIHNHIVFNSTAMDGSRKFKDFWFSGLALQRVSDLVCLENGLSVITPAPYSERQKRTTYPKRETFRSAICSDIDRALHKRPKDFDAFLLEMERLGYEVKCGKHTAIKGKSQKRFIRLSSLDEGYTEADIRAAIAGEARQKPVAQAAHRKERSVNLLIDIQAKLQEKGAGYARWASVYNLKQMSKTLLFLRDHKIENLDQLQELASEKMEKRDALLSSIQASEKRLAEIATLKKHIINYSKTRETYESYRKASYSRKFFEAHREEITLHKAAKQAFDELGVKKIPKVKELSAEYAEILSGKKAAYAEYRKIRDEAQELLIAKRNMDSLYEAENKEEQQTRQQEKQH
ncbi:relaxase/mobilization nuclease domain protein [Oribacterium sp. oral taxon 078 str. F0263]|uniref:relaxase/mobilization nuclease domain-containing protein n=1 Tax=Oribacterium sp. oral taxon 078 TaxID=652706 RepID=UPI0003AE606E|nr:relaxase/mobilization nuclease domain-containing protein [Oribacterium sp. oral taxon 078]ERL22774.1 relaxase/mobilization nuclease domain protein [Oribacterium sp. oral taxon 078 str. F0263]